MQKITSFMAIVLVGIAVVTGLAASPVRASVITTNITPGPGATLNVTAGQLTGAQNVNVLGTLYDVTFVDGSCIALFSGCDEASDFDFTTVATALAAAQALLDQVFFDSVLGSFDTDPENTFGCSSIDFCVAMIPVPFASLTNITIAAAFNREPGALPDSAIGAVVSLSFDHSLNVNQTWATFRPTIAVPEPSTLLLFGVGLVVLAGLRRRRRQA